MLPAVQRGPVGGGGLPPAFTTLQQQDPTGGGNAPRRAFSRGPYRILVTLPALRQRVHTRRRCTVPAVPILPRIETRLTSQRRFVTLWAWLILWPTDGPFPQTSQR